MKKELLRDGDYQEFILFGGHYYVPLHSHPEDGEIFLYVLLNWFVIRSFYRMRTSVSGFESSWESSQSE